MKKNIHPDLLYFSKDQLLDFEEKFPQGVTPDHLSQAWETIHHFFHHWRPQEFKTDLWALLKTALSHEDDTYTGRDRASQLFLYEKVCELTDMLYLVYMSQAVPQLTK